MQREAHNMRISTHMKKQNSVAMLTLTFIILFRLVAFILFFKVLPSRYMKDCCIISLLIDIYEEMWSSGEVPFHGQKTHTDTYCCTSSSVLTLPQKKASGKTDLPTVPNIWPVCLVAFTQSQQLCHLVSVPVCVWVCHCVNLAHTERTVPTRLKKHCSEVGCPFPTGSTFQRLEIPLRTKRLDMIPQDCRRGRELGTVLIRQALLSGKILKGMQPIVVNCMGPHFIPSAAGMCYLFWIGERSILTDDQCLCFVLVSHFAFVDCALFFNWGCINPLKLTWTSHVHIAYYDFSCRLLCTHTPKCAFERKILISLKTHLENSPGDCPM